MRGAWVLATEAASVEVMGGVMWTEAEVVAGSGLTVDFQGEGTLSSSGVKGRRL